MSSQGLGVALIDSGLERFKPLETNCYWGPKTAISPQKVYAKTGAGIAILLLDFDDLLCNTFVLPAAGLLQQRVHAA